jgi:phosphopantothenoylcysteine decarboxylase/phosphopantothenate--cysteine ligase
MARILLGVSGGIAAYKALEFVRLATGAGHSVRVLQTPNSRRFVGAASFEGLTGAPVLLSEFEGDPARGAFPGDEPPRHEPIGHLEIVAKADLLLIAPASANTIAKLAHGHAEGMLCTAALAADCPLVIAPAMNARMYEHPATRANLELLRERGAHVIEPQAGRLASKGEYGIGRLAEPAALLAACQEILEQGVPATDQWAGVKVLITAGGTREPIDAVRFIGNSSSGRMGLALAQAALARGAQVSVIAANVAFPHPAGARWIEAPTAAQMQHACELELPGCDVLLMVAAIADFRPAASVNGKIKKREQTTLTLELEPTPDVLAGLGAVRAEGQTLVGFAAEHGPQGPEHARAKLAEKHLDAIVLNDIARSDIGFGAAENEVRLIASGWELPIEKASKRAVAEAILDAVATLREGSVPVARVITHGQPL